MGRVGVSNSKVNISVNELNTFIQLLENNKYSVVLKKLKSKLPKGNTIRSDDGLTVSERAFKFKENKVKEATPAEIAFKSILDELGYEYEFQKVIWYEKSRSRNKGFYILDFFIFGHKINVEIDGGYHLTEAQKKLDKERSRILKKQGVNTIRFANDTVLKHKELTIKTLKERIEKFKNVSDTTIKYDGVVYKKRKTA